VKKETLQFLHGSETQIAFGCPLQVLFMHWSVQIIGRVSGLGQICPTDVFSIILPRKYYSYCKFLIEILILAEIGRFWLVLATLFRTDNVTSRQRFWLRCPFIVHTPCEVSLMLR